MYTLHMYLLILWFGTFGTCILHGNQLKVGSVITPWSLAVAQVPLCLSDISLSLPLFLDMAPIRDSVSHSPNQTGDCTTLSPFPVHWSFFNTSALHCFLFLFFWYQPHSQTTSSLCTTNSPAIRLHRAGRGLCHMSNAAQLSIELILYWRINAKKSKR